MHLKDVLVDLSFVPLLSTFYKCTSFIVYFTGKMDISDGWSDANQDNDLSDLLHR